MELGESLSTVAPSKKKNFMGLHAKNDFFLAGIDRHPPTTMYTADRLLGEIHISYANRNETSKREVRPKLRYQSILYTLRIGSHELHLPGNVPIQVYLGRD